MHAKSLAAASRRRVLFAAWLTGFLIGTVCPGLSAEDGKSQELNRALADIAAAEQTINRLTAVAEDACRTLTRQSDELRAEIRLERRRTNAASFAQARLISRIDYDLRLLQRLVGHIDRLNERIGYFRSAGHTLESYRRQIRDDQLMLRTLNDVDTGSLMRQLAVDLGQFRNQAGKPLLTASASGLRPLESIWGDLSQGP